MKSRTTILPLLIITLLILLVPVITGQQSKPDYAQPRLPNWEHTEFANYLRVVSFINGEGDIKPGEFRVAALGSQAGKLTFHVFYRRTLAPSISPLWKVRRVNTPEEAFDFINSQGSFEGMPATEFRICGAATTNLPMTFFIFYRELAKNVAPGDWGWKRSETVQDAHKFLSRQAPYTQTITDAEVATVGSNFYIFYKATMQPSVPSRRPPAGWGWVRRESVGSAVDILNSGTSNVKKMMVTARIAAIQEPPYTVFYIFYQ